MLKRFFHCTGWKPGWFLWTLQKSRAGKELSVPNIETGWKPFLCVYDMRLTNSKDLICKTWFSLLRLFLQQWKNTLKKRLKVVLYRKSWYSVFSHNLFWLKSNSKFLYDLPFCCFNRSIMKKGRKKNKMKKKKNSLLSLKNLQKQKIKMKTPKETSLLLKKRKRRQNK